MAKIKEWTEAERKALRQFLEKDYKTKTGIAMRCIEQNGIRPNRCKVACRMNIVSIASDYTGIPVHLIASKNRKSELVDVRRMIMAVMKFIKAMKSALQHRVKRIRQIYIGKNRRFIILSQFRISLNG